MARYRIVQDIMPILIQTKLCNDGTKASQVIQLTTYWTPPACQHAATINDKTIIWSVFSKLAWLIKRETAETSQFSLIQFCLKSMLQVFLLFQCCTSYVILTPLSNIYQICSRRLKPSSKKCQTFHLKKVLLYNFNFCHKMFKSHLLKMCWITWSASGNALSWHLAVQLEETPPWATRLK